MIRARLIFILLMAPSLQACAAFSGVTPTNLEPILVETKRADVEAVLGDLAERKPNGCGSIDTYRYNRGRRAESAVMALGMVHPAAPLVVGLVAHPFLYYGQKADLDVVYDRNDTVIKFGPRDTADWDSLFSNNHLWVDKTTARDVAEHYHRFGVVETANPETSRTCLCHAAHLGHPDSRFHLAETFGSEPGPAGGTPALALAAFVTAAPKVAAPSVSKRNNIATGVIPHGNDGSQPPLIPTHVIACACGVQPAKATPPSS